MKNVCAILRMISRRSEVLDDDEQEVDLSMDGRPELAQSVRQCPHAAQATSLAHAGRLYGCSMQRQDGDDELDHRARGELLTKQAHRLLDEMADRILPVSADTRIGPTYAASLAMLAVYDELRYAHDAAERRAREDAQRQAGMIDEINGAIASLGGTLAELRETLEQLPHRLPRGQ